MLEKSAAKPDELERFDDELGRMLQSFFPGEHRRRPHRWRPPTDVYETEDAVVVQMEIAGIDPDNLQISFTDRMLSIRGRREDGRRKVSVHRIEITFGDFGTDLHLPGAFQEELIEAKYESGFLVVTLPKRKPVSILVQSPPASE